MKARAAASAIAGSATAPGADTKLPHSSAIAPVSRSLRPCHPAGNERAAINARSGASSAVAALSPTHAPAVPPTRSMAATATGVRIGQPWHTCLPGTRLNRDAPGLRDSRT